MTRDEYLLELQRRIAEERGYDGRSMLGVPRWPWDWCAVGALVEEMHAAPECCGVSVQCYKFRSFEDEVYRPRAAARMTRWADLRGGSEINYPFDGEGSTEAEAICRAWCAWKGIDLSDLPSVPPEVPHG